METYADRLAAEAKKQALLEQIKGVVGRDYHLPRKLIDRSLNPDGVDPVAILVWAGYRRHYHKLYGYIRKLETGRFHAYIGVDGQIYLHNDEVILNKKKKTRHLATVKGVALELKALKKIRDRMAIELGIAPPPSLPEETKKAKKRRLRKESRIKVETLPWTDYVNAMEKLKQERLATPERMSVWDTIKRWLLDRIWYN